MGEFEKALATYAAYLKIDPERLEIIEKRGDTYVEMAETAKAKSKPNDEIANYKSAITEFEKVVRVDADNERVWKLSLIHISEPTRLLSISYAVFCLKKNK